MEESGDSPASLLVYYLHCSWVAFLVVLPISSSCCVIHKIVAFYTTSYSIYSFYSEFTSRSSKIDKEVWRSRKKNPWKNMEGRKLLLCSSTVFNFSNATTEKIWEAKPLHWSILFLSDYMGFFLRFFFQNV